MKKKYLILAVATALCLVGCGKTTESAVVDEQPVEQQTTVAEDEVEDTTVEDTTDVADDGKMLTYADLTKVNFTFSSGAGGWGTELYVNEDGSFTAEYHDSDMGDMGEEYPNGTIYASVVHGEFGELEKVSDTIYKTQILGMKYEFEPDTEEIIDGVRYLYSEPYGLDGGEDFYFYLPGTKIGDIDEATVQWAQMCMALDIEASPEELKDQELPFYMLENKSQNYGFVGYEISE